MQGPMTEHGRFQGSEWWQVDSYPSGLMYHKISCALWQLHFFERKTKSNSPAFNAKSSAL